MRRLALAVLALLLLARPALALPSLWVVHGPDCDITLFGSVHVLPEGTIWEPPALATALDQADELWFEIPVDDGGLQQAVQAARARALLPPGQSLTQLMSAAAERRLEAIARTNKLSMPTLDRMQPWFADMLVSSFAYAKLGAKQDAGVEESLAKAAPKARRMAFETAQQQIGMVADAPLAVQVASLESSLKEADQDPDEYRNLVADWLKGDGKALYRHEVLTLKRETPELFDRLIVQRNAAWTDILTERLKGRGHVVVVVGAGHLVGPEGVPARLRALGFVVDGPKD
jgi:uncharacterized protein YbaP (TraB family)